MKAPAALSRSKKRPERKTQADQTTACTFAIITTDANELVAKIHDRMPLILAPSEYEGWLSDDPGPCGLMRAFPAKPMRMWAISARVNKPENDDPDIVRPLALEESVEQPDGLPGGCYVRKI